jgi:hypothetical protein
VSGKNPIISKPTAAGQEEEELFQQLSPARPGQPCPRPLSWGEQRLSSSDCLFNLGLQLSPSWSRLGNSRFNLDGLLPFYCNRVLATVS